MQFVYIFLTLDGTFEVIEAYRTKIGFSHNEKIIASKFNNKQEALNYCRILEYYVLN